MKKQPKLSSLIDKAVFDYNLIEPGDRILIGASGGKDSTALIHYFSNRVKRPDCNFEYKALNIQNDFAQSFPEQIIKLFEEWKVPQHPYWGESGTRKEGYLLCQNNG